MIAHVIDAVLLIALILTSLRVGSTYRELKRLRGYQAQYLHVFDKTSRAVGDIDTAVRGLNEDGRDLLRLLDERIEEARGLAERLERLQQPERPSAATSSGGDIDDIGTYSPVGLAREVTRLKSNPPGRDLATTQAFWMADVRRPSIDDGSAGGAIGAAPIRSFRMAPSVKTLRTANGRDA